MRFSRHIVMNVENIMGRSICQFNTSCFLTYTTPLLFYILLLSTSIAAELLRQWMDIIHKRTSDTTVTIDIIVSNVSGYQYLVAKIVSSSSGYEGHPLLKFVYVFI